MLTVTIFISYFLLILIVGLVSGRKGSLSSEEYFLAGRKLPWYAVGLSMVGSNISTEHFIGMTGAAYLYGIAPANWELTAFIPLSILIFFFLPYYFRAKLFTIPQYLEQRYNAYTRTIFASLTLLHLTAVLLAGALYAGGLIFQDIFYPEQSVLNEQNEISFSLLLGILVIAFTTGIYSIYGGLSSVVWTDVVQVIILLSAGCMLVVFALLKSESLAQVWQTNYQYAPSRTQLILPSNHSFAPWTGIASLWLTLGIWYNCTNQFYIQRCFGAKSEWDARMGVLLNAFIKFFTPVLVVLPGIIAFSYYGDSLPADKVFMQLVQDFLPPWVVAIVLTGMAAAIMSTVSSVLNSASTIFCIDFYQRYINPDASQQQIVKVGRWTTAVILLIAMVWSPFVLLLGDGLFVYIQEMSGFFAPPISVIFIMAIFWKKANARAANLTLIIGFAFGLILKLIIVNSWLETDSYLEPFLNRALVSFIFSAICFVIIASLNNLPTNLMANIIWKVNYARLPEKERYKGLKNFMFWWIVVLILRVAVYIIFT